MIMDLKFGIEIIFHNVMNQLHFEMHGVIDYVLALMKCSYISVAMMEQ